MEKLIARIEKLINDSDIVMDDGRDAIVCTVKKTIEKLWDWQPEMIMAAFSVLKFHIGTITVEDYSPCYGEGDIIADHTEISSKTVYAFYNGGHSVYFNGFIDGWMTSIEISHYEWGWVVK